jgi:hypothetical protein
VFVTRVYILVRKLYLFPPLFKSDIFTSSHDMSFFVFDFYRTLFALILHYFEFILPLYLPFSFLSPFFLFLLHFPPFLFFFLFFSPQMTLADIPPRPGGGGGSSLMTPGLNYFHTCGCCRVTFNACWKWRQLSYLCRILCNETSKNE